MDNMSVEIGSLHMGGSVVVPVLRSYERYLPTSQLLSLNSFASIG